MVPGESSRRRCSKVLAKGTVSIDGAKSIFFQKPKRLGIQIAEDLSLKTIGDYCKQKMSGQVGWCLAPEHGSPSSA